jgi:NAD(P)-dependent dehydrogenase (short-subunit alcohol dehydrogenase family)
MRRLDGKTAVVTGGATGIGRSTALRLADDGASVLVIDRAHPTEPFPPAVHVAEGDVTDAASLEAALTQLEAGPDICVANAGISLVEDFADGDVDAWRRVLDVNLLGVMVTFKVAARRMIAAGRGGRLLATSSLAGVRGEARIAAYAASKAGVVALVKTLAAELAPHRITVNAVAPGQIDTAMNARDLELDAAAQGLPVADVRQAFIRARIPIGRMGLPEEVAGLFAFLASDEAEFITGETVCIDGGERVITP